jgi:hypothetical protein
MTLFVTIAYKSIDKTRSLSAVEMTLFVQLPGKVLAKHGR